MKKTIHITVFGIFALLLSTCGNQPSLERYFVEKMEDSAFLFVNIPMNFKTFFASEEALTEGETKALESVKKLNVLIFKPSEESKARLSKEIETVSSILKNRKFEPLLSFGARKNKGQIFYTGKTNNIDEGIIWVHNSEEGFAIIRVLGKDMNPAKLIQMAQKIDESNFKDNFQGQFGSLLDTFEGLEGEPQKEEATN